MDQVSEQTESTLAARALRVAFVPGIAVTLADILLCRPLLHCAGATDWTGDAAAAADLLAPVVLATRCVLLVVAGCALAAARVPQDRDLGRTARLFVTAAALAALHPLCSEASFYGRIVIGLGALLATVRSPTLRPFAAALALAACGDIASTVLPHGPASAWTTDALLIASFVLLGIGLGSWKNVQPALAALLTIALLEVFPELAANAARLAPLRFEVLPPTAGLAVLAWASMVALRAPRTARRLLPALLMLLTLGGADLVDLATAGVALLLFDPGAWPVQSRGGVDSPLASPADPAASSSPL